MFKYIIYDIEDDILVVTVLDAGHRKIFTENKSFRCFFADELESFNCQEPVLNIRNLLKKLFEYAIVILKLQR
jgi:hypothetical protein